MKRRFFAPEVMQSSSMDCGPAALKCLLEGHGIHVGYGRLREACQTGVDGTSVTALEEVAVQLGLQANQMMVPLDHLLDGKSQALPALLVVNLPGGEHHFAVVWRKLGPWVQVMDPSKGRHWQRSSRLEEQAYQHAMPMAAADWFSWAATGGFLAPLVNRLQRLGFSRQTALAQVGAAAGADMWLSLAALDAGVRMSQSLRDAGAINKTAAQNLVTSLTREAVAADDPVSIIPDAFWSARPLPAGRDGVAQVEMRGAVVIHVAGASSLEDTAALSPELAAAMEQPVDQAGKLLWQLLRQGGLFQPLLLLIALVISTLGVAAEGLLFRGFIEMGHMLGLPEQRLAAAALALSFLVALLLLRLPITAGSLRLGRHLEVRLRLAFLQKIPRMADRYFHSRLTSDMAERGHAIHQVRQLPILASQCLDRTCALIITTGALCWLSPAVWPWVLVSALTALVLPLLLQPLIAERDMRVRAHDGALSGFYLDGLRGIIPVRTHGGEKNLLREHEQLLTEWTRASYSLLFTIVATRAQTLVTYALAIVVVWQHLHHTGEGASLLLLVYWALQLPMIGEDLANLITQYPAMRNLTLRLMEPLGAPEESLPAEMKMPVDKTAGVAIELKQVGLSLGGSTLLHQIDLKVKAGEHLALVGPSGAGKSSLVGLLLGWHKPSSGDLLVDGQALEAERLLQLRRHTAWVDPAVQLWNRSLLYNLQYGNDPSDEAALETVLTGAELIDVLKGLPDGLQTRPGDSGGLLSGGEGQRVRLGRAFARRQVRLVILDEAFRGLDRPVRRRLLRQTRQLWPQATLICITHDLWQSQDFQRVLVLQEGSILQDGAPTELARQTGTYRDLLQAAEAANGLLRSQAGWRRLHLQDGQLQSTTREDA